MSKELKSTGWWEDYECGCTSETVRYKKDLLGYCNTHGHSRRYIWPNGIGRHASGIAADRLEAQERRIKLLREALEGFRTGKHNCVEDSYPGHCKECRDNADIDDALSADDQLAEEE